MESVDQSLFLKVEERLSTLDNQLQKKLMRTMDTIGELENIEGKSFDEIIKIKQKVNDKLQDYIKYAEYIV